MFFGRGFGMVLGVFRVTFWCQNDAREEKGRFVEMLVLHKEILMFAGVVGEFVPAGGTPGVTPRVTPGGGCDPSGLRWGASVLSILRQNMSPLPSGRHILRRRFSRGPLYILYRVK